MSAHNWLNILVGDKVIILPLGADVGFWKEEEKYPVPLLDIFAVFLIIHKLVIVTDLSPLCLDNPNNLLEELAIIYVFFANLLHES